MVPFATSMIAAFAVLSDPGSGQSNPGNQRELSDPGDSPKYTSAARWGHVAAGEDDVHADGGALLGASTSSTLAPPRTGQ